MRRKRRAAYMKMGEGDPGELERPWLICRLAVTVQMCSIASLGNFYKEVESSGL
jgi:hypothetical protein